MHLPPCMRRDCCRVTAARGGLGHFWSRAAGIRRGLECALSSRCGAAPVRAVAVDGGYRVTGRWSLCQRACMPPGSLGQALSTLAIVPALARTDSQRCACYFFQSLTARSLILGMSSVSAALAAMTLLSRMSSCPESVRCHAVNRSGHNTLGRSTPLELARCLTRRFIPPGLGWHRSALPQCVCIARGAIDAFLELAGSKTPGRGKALLRDNAVIQARVGQGRSHLARCRCLSSGDGARGGRQCRGHARVLLSKS